MPAQSYPRAYSAAHFALEIDNQPSGFVRSVEGGGIKAEILNHQVGGHPGAWRQLSRPKYDDIKLQVGMSMSPAFYTWIESFFSGKGTRKSGAIVAGDFQYRERARREFMDAIISELSFPALDAGDRNACTMGVTLVPERVTFVKGESQPLERFVGSMRQKLWTPANFELVIDGLETACRRVTKIDGFSIKQEVLEHAVGGQRDALRVPGVIEFPNLSFSIPEVDVQPLLDHFEKSAMSGKGRDGRLTGHIMLRDHRQDPLCTLDLFGIDIAAITPDNADATTDEIKQIKVEIAVEGMALKYAA